jgi:hypothetical protein
MQIAIWCACGSLAVIVLLIRDSGWQFDRRLLVRLLSFTVLLMWSVAILVQMYNAGTVS